MSGKVPALRFPRYQNAAQPSKLGNEAKIETGNLDANAMVSNGRFRFYTCARDYFHIDSFAWDTEALLISGNGANVGYIHYYVGKFNAYQRTYVLTNFGLYAKWLKFQLEKGLRRRLYSEVKEGNTPYIVKSTLSEYPLKVPALPEQKKIADFLTTVDKRIELLKKKKAKLEEYKKGLLQKLFPKVGESVPELRFEGFEGKWKSLRLEELCTFRSGKTPTIKKEDFWHGDIPWFSGESMTSKYLTVSRRKITKKAMLSGAPHCDDNHLLILVRGNIRKQIPIGLPMLISSFNQDLKCLLCEKIDREFLYYTLQSVNHFLVSKTTLSSLGIGKLDTPVLRRIIMQIPILNERNLISDFLQMIDHQHTLLTEQLKIIQKWKKGLLQRMFV